METWHATTDGRLLAHRDEATDHIVLDFGKHYGMALPQVASSYLMWLLSRGGGQLFVPADLLARVQIELDVRATEAGPRAFSVPSEAVLAWAATAPAADVAELAADLRGLADLLDATLDTDADETAARLLMNLPGEAVS